MSPKVSVVIAPCGGGFTANSATVGLLASVNLQMVGEVIAASETFSARRALEVPRAVVFGHVTLPVGLSGKLKATLVADERFYPLMGAHVRV